MRRLLCLLLLVLLPLHGFAALQGTATPSETAKELTHELDHQYGISHHHGDDGDIHYDDSGESSQHFAEHAGAGQPSAVPSLLTPKLVLLVMPLLRYEPTEFIADAFLERLPRPPQTFG